MGSGQKVMKWLMLAFNLLFWVSGIGLIIAGAIAQTVYKPYLSFLDGTYVSAPVVLIVVGAIITIIAFFGCCGSAKENYCMLMTFAVLLAAIFFAELAAGIVGYMERGQISGYLNKNMANSLHHFNATADRQVWDGMQSELHCCGALSWRDWTVGNGTNRTVPDSCCKTHNTVCNRNTSALAENCASTTDEGTFLCPIYVIGCSSLVQNKLEHSISLIAGVGIGVAFIQVVGIVLACVLARRVKRGYTYA